eukprot:104321-Rhodomonas_salina.1
MCGDCFGGAGPGGIFDIFDMSGDDTVSFPPSRPPLPRPTSKSIGCVSCSACMRSALTGGGARAGPNGYCVSDPGMPGPSARGGMLCCLRVLDVWDCGLTRRCVAVPESYVLFTEAGGNFIEGLMGSSRMTRAERKAGAKQLCENPCVYSFFDYALTSYLPAAEECLPPDQIFNVRVIKTACFENGNDYCIETIGNHLMTGMMMNAQCGISQDLEWDPKACDAACKAQVQNLSSTWGCCLGSLNLPIAADLETECSLSLPGACASAGRFSFGIAVENLRYEWIQAKLDDKLITGAIKVDVGKA